MAALYLTIGFIAGVNVGFLIHAIMWISAASDRQEQRLKQRAQLHLVKS